MIGKNIHPDAVEHIPDNVPTAYDFLPVDVTAFVDSGFHANCLQTGRSSTALIIVVGHTITKWHSKRQHTVETSTHGAELVALRIAVEAILEIRHKLRMMGIKFNPVSTILCDNMSVVINMQFPTSSLKKKHNAVAYHKAREAVAARMAPDWSHWKRKTTSLTLTAKQRPLQLTVVS